MKALSLEAPRSWKRLEIAEPAKPAVDTRPWNTHRCTFDELIEVFPSYTQPETGVIKAIVAVTDT